MRAQLPTLLVISENPSVRVWIKKHLEAQFFILTAENREEALQALHARLDCILVDANLEELDLFPLCKTLSQATQKQLTPIFLITGKLKKSFREKALQYGVTDFLSDPLDLEEFAMKMKESTKKTTAAQKTEEISATFKTTKPSRSSSSLKEKLILPGKEKKSKQEKP